MDEIQGNVIKRGKRNAISRRLHAKDDEQAIATWRSELDSIQRVFKVRSVACLRLLLSILSQTELRVNTHPTVPSIHTTVPNVRRDIPNAENTVLNVHHDVLNIHPVVSGARGDITNTHTTASDTPKSREDVGDQNQAVSIVYALTVTG